KNFDTVATKTFDWGTRIEARGNAAKDASAVLLEAYGKIRLGKFQLKAGRSKDIVGLTGDSVLTSGNFAVSGNSLGIPKIEISIPDYYTLPIFDDLISFK